MTVIVLLLDPKLDKFESLTAFIGTLALDIAYTLPALVGLYIK
jgi:hypothetical protein